MKEICPKGCHFYSVIQGKESGCQNITVPLDGDWIVFHSRNKPEDKCYFGKLILATRKHHTDLDSLSAWELGALGKNIQLINTWLIRYWNKEREHFHGDVIERLHIGYLNETPYFKAFQESVTQQMPIADAEKKAIEEMSHIHFHLLPRTRNMGQFFKYDSEKMGWKLLDNIAEFCDIHSEYQVKNCSQVERVQKMMIEMKKSISSR